VDVLDGAGQLRRIVVHHSDPAQVELARELQRRYPPRLDAPVGVPAVLRTGQPELVKDFPPEQLRAAAVDAEQRTLLEQVDLRSWIIVPLVARGRTLGALTLVRGERRSRFDEQDLRLAEELARRSALAVDNSMLYAQAENARASLERLVMQAPAALTILRGKDLVFETANGPYLGLVQNRPIVGLPIREALPELEGQGYFELLERVYSTGETVVRDETLVKLLDPATGKLEDRYFNFTYQSLRKPDGTPDGVIAFAYEVTALVRARAVAAASAEQLRRRNAQLGLAADVGIAFTQSSSLTEMLQRCSQAMVDRLGAAFARIWTLNERDRMLELQSSAGMYTHVDGPHARVPVGKFKIGLIAEEGKPHLTNSVLTDPRVGNPEWARREGMVSFAGYPLKVDGKVIGVMAMFARSELPPDTLDALASVADAVAVGIERKRAEARLKDESETLEVLNTVGQTLAAELNTDALVQAITDSATRLSGAQFGSFFYNVVDERGEAYTLYTISGVPREAFSKFPMPRNTKVFSPTFAGEGIVRVDDITQDPRYGKNAPYFGKPKGHLPVVSYLAVPVISRTGKVIGGLFFGHEKAGVFTERAERLVKGVAAQAAVAMDNARLYREATQLIRALERSNAELDQFAYVASHDLKAPLRGIANLASWLEEDLGAQLTGQAKRQLELLRGRVKRMEGLIDGILAYSRAGRTRAQPEPLELSRQFREWVELLAPRPPAEVVLPNDLPTVFSEKVPLQQAFMNLVSNALKHARRPDVRIEVTWRDAGDRVEFRVKDNGPGIAPEYHEKVWAIFQTLEARDKVESTGIGLSIVRKIVESRGGRVGLESSEGQGATFSFTWPKRQEVESNG
jgi:GAF domain-containing protein